MAKEKSYFYKLYRVTRSDGRVTTVSIDPTLVTHAVKAFGSDRQVGTFVREVAASYQDGQWKSCSGFVSKQLEMKVAELRGQGSMRHAFDCSAHLHA